jgi:dipeptidyl aminopeptidase/acylaminoacyl peptidase
LQFAVTADEQHVVYFAEDARQDEDLWISDAQFRNSRRLTHLNPQFDAQSMGHAQLVHWLAENGEPLQGVLLLPVDYKEGVRYPLLVWVYGGVSLSDHFDRFGLAYRGVFNMQLFATRGYAVLLPDAPLRLGTPMLDLALTVLPGVNKIIEMGIADPNRLGVMGHSYGGYSTLGLIVQTSRFKAAVDIDGLGDLGAAYGEMDSDGTAFDTAIEETGQGQMGGTPWQFRDRYVENSPIFYLNRTNTPLLIIHGSDDKTVAPFLGDEIFVGLRRLGKEVEYAKYQGEGHSPLYWSYANQVDVANRMISWFDAHLKDAGERDKKGPAK